MNFRALNSPVSGPATAATLTVDNSTCDLISAITAANTDTATGGCPAGNGADTLNLTAPAYTLNVVNNLSFNYGGNGLPVVSSIITVNGDPDGDRVPAVIQRAALPDTPDFRLFFVDSAGDLTLNRVIVRNGRNHYGAGIFAYEGTLNLVSSTITENALGYAVQTRAVDFFNRGALTVTDSSISNNNYGGINCGYSGCTVQNSTISRNGGAGIESCLYDHGYAAHVRVTNTTLSGNKGSGISSCKRVSVTATNVTVSNNDGSGISSQDFKLINSTVSGNGSGGVFGGYIPYCGEGLISNSTIVSNNGPGVRIWGYGCRYGVLKNTIVAGNRGEDCYSNETKLLTLAGNLIGDGSCDAAELGALTGDPKLGPLTDNGGRTFSHALLRGSPAINTGPSSACQATDQRGAKRPQGARCDLGAYEVNMVPAPIIRPIVTFFDQAVQAGTLVGTFGVRGNWHRLQAVRRQLLLAGDFNRQGSNTDFCRQTGSTLGRINTDGGAPDKNDYVTGAAAPELTMQLTALRTDLGCQ